MGARWGSFGLGIVLAALVGCTGNRGGAPGSAPSACVPTSCEALGKSCGAVQDGCGGLLDCGSCPAGQRCGGGGAENVCGAADCVPTSCEAQARNCGTISDGCGGTLSCGSCPEGQRCGAGGTPNVCGFGEGARACSRDGFCWVNPAPMGLTLLDTWGAAPDDLWAVGEGGYVEHWDGARLSLTSLGVALNGIWGSSADHVWAVGEAIVHWDGTTWSTEAQGLGVILRDVWGTSPEDVWAVGEGGRVMHRTRLGWRVVDAGITRTLNAVWASGPRDVWIAGEGGEIRRFDGKAWSAVPPPERDRAVVTLWGSRSGDVWAGTAVNGMYRWNGSGWIQTPFPGVARAIWGLGPNDVWAAGELDAGDGNQRDDGFIAHWSGTAWSVRREPLSPVLGIWGTPAAVWFVGRQGTVLQRRAAAWAPISTQPFRVDGIHAAGPADVWLVSSHSRQDSTFSRWDGRAFTTEVNPFGPGSFLALGGSSRNDVWAVGDADCVGHWDGSAWSRVETDVKNLTLTGVWASGPNDAWAVGFFHDNQAGVALHWNGRRWARSIAARLTAVWGSASDDVWAVGPRSIAHFDGAEWTFSRPPDGSRFPFFAAVWGSGPSDVWAVGSDEEDASNLLWRWDGTRWSRVVHPEIERPLRGGAPALLSVAGTGPDDVYVVGTRGSVLHWDGRTWRRLETGLSPDTGDVLRAVAVVGSDVWIVGRDGAVLRRQR